MQTATKLKKAPYMGNCYIGDTLLDIHGYGRGEVEEVYISDTYIDLKEMIHSLCGWDKFEQIVDHSFYGV
jgi:hypothetical protein